MNIIFSVFTAYKRRLLKSFIIFGLLFMTAIKCYSQKLTCEQTEILFPTISLLNFPSPKPEDKSDQEDVLIDLQMNIAAELTRKNPYLQINRVHVSQEVTQSYHGLGYAYILLATLNNQDGGVQLRLTVKTSCSNKVIAKTDVFLRHTFFSENPEQLAQLARQAASTLSSLINIKEFELRERETNNYGLGGEYRGGRIIITVDKTLVKGQETQVQMKLIDCDGEVLRNKQISTESTIGGIFTPATSTTDGDGIATAKFKMISDKRAIIVAQCKTKNVWGCQDLYEGAEFIKGVGGIPLKIELVFSQNETRTLKRATLPGIKIKGGEETEMIEMRHSAVLYHFPSPASLKQGFLVETVKDSPSPLAVVENNPYPGSKTEYVTESGYFFYSKNVAGAKIIGMAGDVEVVQGSEEGSTEEMYGTASLQHPSEITFYRGDANNPPQFSWHVEYPASNNGIGGGGMVIAKDDDDVKWEVKKITDSKSIYKTEYLLSKTINIAEEFKKGDKAMKDLFGFNLDELAGKIDPTKPQNNIAGASGSQTITVRILSPFPE